MSQDVEGGIDLGGIHPVVETKKGGKEGTVLPDKEFATLLTVEMMDSVTVTVLVPEMPNSSL